MDRKPYLTDVSDEEWAFVAPYLTLMTEEAPPDKHLLVNSDETLSLGDTARVKFSRPAANNFFESVAKSFKEQAIAVVLTGRDSDGATGIQAIQRADGTVIVQDEATCECFSMPQSAIELRCVDFVFPLSAIANRLSSLVIPKKQYKSQAQLLFSN